MINDQPGISDPRELVQIGGKGYIFEGKDVIVPLPEHAKVYTASQTKQMMAASGNTAVCERQEQRGLGKTPNPTGNISARSRIG